MQKDTIFSILFKDSDFSNYFNRNEIKMLIEFSRYKEFNKHTKIFTESEPSSSLYIILSGEVKIIMDNLLLSALGAGNIVGESMFLSQPIRMVSVETVTDTKTIQMDHDNFYNFLHSDSDTAIKFKNFFKARALRHSQENSQHSQTDPKKYLALIAHNDMKPKLLEFIKKNKAEIEKFPLVATGTTGAMLYENAGIILSKKVSSGPLGGDQAIGHMVSTDNILGVIFFKDPLSAHPHTADIQALGRLCDVYQVPFATNPGTGRCVLHYLSDFSNTQFEESNDVMKKYISNQKKNI